jgi:hypothetical protein
MASAFIAAIQLNINSKLSPHIYARSYSASVIIVKAIMSVLQKFVSDEIVGDLTDQAPGKLLKVTYPSGVEASGVELTPTQVKDEPKIEWEAEEGAFYTLLLTGE